MITTSLGVMARDCWRDCEGVRLQQTFPTGSHGGNVETPVGRPREPNIGERDKTQTGEGLDGEKASIKAHKKSGEAAEEYTE
jgi:hypothetical protein